MKTTFAAVSRTTAWPRRFRGVRRPAAFVAMLAFLVVAPGLATLTGCGSDKKTTAPPQPPVPHLVAPNGGETFLTGTSTEITWTVTGGAVSASSIRISLDFSLNGGASWIPVAIDDQNDGSFTWAVPNVGTAQGMIRVTANDGTNQGSDTSDGMFTILTTPPVPHNTIYVGEESAAPGASLDVPFLLNNQDEAGLVEARIWYDPAVAGYQSARLTGRGTGMQIISLTLAADTVKVTVQQQAGVTVAPGDGPIAFLTFRLLGAGGTTTALRPRQVRLLSPAGGALSVQTQDGSITVMNVDTPATLTDAGWAAFEGGNFDLAAQKFEAAIGLDPQYGPAYTGQGWVELTRATTPAEFRAVVSSFDAAVGRGQTGAEVRGGRAAASLALGGTDLAGAVQDAQAAVAASPSFVFAHRNSFDFRDLHLIAAFAYAGQGNQFTAARGEADQVQPSNISQANPQSWQVDGVVYPTFDAAVLAWLHKMSATFAG